MTGLLIILVSFAFGIAGGFLAMHFYFQHHEFVEKSRFDTLESYATEQINNIGKIFKSMDHQLDILEKLINVCIENQRVQERKIDDHYRWSLGIWNDIANHRESIENPIPESIQEVAREEVQLNEDEEVMPMGPIEFQQSEMQVVKEGDPIDIKVPDRVKPLRQDKKKKGKKNA